jgi:ABC-type branched-subunit amino acid transport system substrate-binding protein
MALMMFVLTLTQQKAMAKAIRVAVLDNLRSEQLSSERYAVEYLRGLELGVQEAKRQGVEFSVRKFFFDKKPGDVFDKISQIETWKPDVVLGPRSSDYMLLLRKNFSNTLVVSPSATAELVASLPENFYSFAPPNSESIGHLVDFVKKTFPNRSVFQLVQIDCSNCKDFAAQFVKASSLRGVNIRNDSTATYLSSTADSFNIKEQLASYKSGDIVLLPNNSYSSGIVMGRGNSNHHSSMQATALRRGLFKKKMMKRVDLQSCI